MEGQERNLSIVRPYPILFIPKKCTVLETDCEKSENVFIHLNISSPDTESKETVIYNGLCSLKIVDGNDINIRYCTQNSTSSNENVPVTLTEANRTTFPTYNDSQVWIDPSISPYVYNSCGTPPLELYAINESLDNGIIIEQHNTYITQTVDNYNEAIQYSPVSDDQASDEKINESVHYSDDCNMYEEEEIECGVFLSQLSEEIINEKKTQAQNERMFVGLKTDNEALKQLMSRNVQSVSKQQKTILFLGHDARSGQTIQNISINDPSMDCMETENADSEIADDPTPSDSNPISKKYQCNKCKQVFNRLVAIKQHMVGNHRFDKPQGMFNRGRYTCSECGKNLKTQEKLKLHCLGHGDPDLECNKCHKVFASKLSLRNHVKVHTRTFPCNYCFKSYSTASALYSHTAKAHNVFMCSSCPFSCRELVNLRCHQQEHKQVLVKTVSKTCESDFAERVCSEVISDISGPTQVVKMQKYEPVQETDSEQQCSSSVQLTLTTTTAIANSDAVQEANSVIARVMSNQLFQSYGKNHKKRRKCVKTCNVCFKKFTRIDDLKRHLIEHIIRSTLAKNPVNSFGVLNIRCEICQEKVFSKIDRYKTHLREHAKLTLYKCTFCDKSFSDSSNFSKHKKIHGTTFFQCDICERKFNSKKMITQHMDYHNKNSPLECQYCEKLFYFESALNKHIKYSHSNKECLKFRCRFCRDYFKSQKDKWDHEWIVHKLRKEIMDCVICSSRFRKYAELKRHCMDEHTVIPPAKKLLRWKLKNEKKTTEGQQDWPSFKFL